MGFEDVLGYRREFCLHGGDGVRPSHVQVESMLSPDALAATLAGSSLFWIHRHDRVLQRRRLILFPVAPERRARRRWVTRKLAVGLALAPLDFLLQRAQVLPLPLLDDFRRRRVDGTFAPRDGGDPVLHDHAGYW